MSSNQESSILILPPEIHELIISHLAALDEPQLSSVKACALSCRAFTLFCQQQIFSKIEFNSIYNAQPSKFRSKLVALLGSSPHLGAYIRNLDYYIVKSYVQRDGLPEALRTITRLHHLRIAYNPSDVERSEDPGCPGWLERFTAGTSRRFQHLLQLPTLVSLGLGPFIDWFALSDLMTCKNLRVLHLIGAEFLDDLSFHVGGSSQQWPVEPPLLLEELVVSQGAKFKKATPTLLCATYPNGTLIMNFVTLKKVSLCIYSKEDLSVIKLLFSQPLLNLVEVDLLREFMLYLNDNHLCFFLQFHGPVCHFLPSGSTRPWPPPQSRLNRSSLIFIPS